MDEAAPDIRAVLPDASCKVKIAFAVLAGLVLAAVAFLLYARNR